LNAGIIRRPFRTELIWVWSPDTPCLANIRLCLWHEAFASVLSVPLWLIRSLGLGDFERGADETGDLCGVLAHLLVG
jgi:hypothetical protein